MSQHTRRLFASLFAAATIPFAASCVPSDGSLASGEPTRSVRSALQSPDPNGGTSGTSSTNHTVPDPVCLYGVTVSGSAFYNDQRTYGRFHKRQTPVGASGVQYRKLAAYDGSNRPDNYLGLWEATVNLYETDGITGGTGCSARQLLGSTTIAADGSWSWTGDICDACGDDDALERTAQGRVGVSLLAEVSLEYCPDNPNRRCFFVKNPGAFSSKDIDFPDHGDGAVTYTRSYGTSVRYDEKPVDFGRLDFESRHADYTDQYAQAALVHASMVDVTRKINMEEHVSFKDDEFGSIDVIYPINFDYGANHSHESGKICILAPGTAVDPDGDGNFTVSSTRPTGWLEGSTAMHEYGHIVNYRAWGGNGKWVDYGYNGDGGEQDSAEYRAAAFKENWADFVKRVTLEDVTTAVSANTLGCSTSTTYDDDVSSAGSVCPTPTACSLGDRSPGAVEHALCDWYDARADQADADSDPDAYDGGGESLSSSFADIHDALERAWDDATSHQRAAYIDGQWDNTQRVRDDGLRLCDVTAAWALTNPASTSLLDKVMVHNGIACF